ncbi:MAG: S-layer homology domain-containing protein [Oscillospiraceae bacterium]|nr:S-layer homology domain-containing protein [Oscillospiraceae bacterium]
MDNFDFKRQYDERFGDVTRGAWYCDYVECAYELKLLDGMSDSIFAPQGNLTVAECVKLASCLHQIYNEGDVTLQNAQNNWFSNYVNYALQNGVLPYAFMNYNRPATRCEVAVIFANALPEEALTAINAERVVPDVASDAWYADEVQELFCAGVLTGYEDGCFRPDSQISRAEISAMVARMAQCDLRVTDNR